MEKYAVFLSRRTLLQIFTYFQNNIGLITTVISQTTICLTKFQVLRITMQAVSNTKTLPTWCLDIYGVDTPNK